MNPHSVLQAASRSAVDERLFDANGVHDVALCFTIWTGLQAACARLFARPGQNAAQRLPGLPNRLFRRGLAVAGVAGLCLSGCGRPASPEQCENIVERVTILELKEAKIEEPEQIKQHVAETKTRFQSAMQEHCVGKRITRGALECIEKATSTEQVFEECLD